MKRLLSLFLCLSCLACGKDDDKAKFRFSEQEIFNAIQGTWKRSRLAYDAEFKNLIPIVCEYECERDDYTIFQPDSTLIYIDNCSTEDDIDKFEISPGVSYDGETDLYISSNQSGVNLVPGMVHSGVILYSYTDSTLVFHKVGYYENKKKILIYAEVKRVKGYVYQGR